MEQASSFETTSSVSGEYQTRPAGLLSFTGVYSHAAWGEIQENEQQQQILLQLAAFLDNPLNGSHWQIRSRKLSFYAGFELHEIIDKENGCHSFYLYQSGAILPLEGESRPIHFLNDVGFLSLEQSNVIDYVRFFNEFVSAEHGNFNLIDDVTAIDLNQFDSSCQQTLSNLTLSSPHILDDHEKCQDGYVIKAAVLYDNEIAEVIYLIEPNGKVHMLEETTLLENLPVIERANIKYKMVSLDQLLLENLDE